jgi:hypothetical protein
MRGSSKRGGGRDGCGLIRSRLPRLGEKNWATASTGGDPVSLDALFDLVPLCTPDVGFLSAAGNARQESAKVLAANVSVLKQKLVLSFHVLFAAARYASSQRESALHLQNLRQRTKKNGGGGKPKEERGDRLEGRKYKKKSRWRGRGREERDEGGKS